MSLLSDVSAVVLCFNRQDEVLVNVPKRISDVHQHGLELVVVDNCSSDGTREAIKDIHKADPCFKLVLNDQNLGVGAGRNSGWHQTTRDLVVTLDEDTHITTHELIELISALRQAPHIGIVTPIMFHPVTQRLLVEVMSPPYQVTNFHGACYAIRREVIDAVGFHDDQCDFGGEELDLSIRVRNAGWDVIQVPDLRVAHNGRQRASGSVVPLSRRLPWTRNHARVVWRWFPYFRALPWSLLMLLSQLKGASKRGALRELPELVSAWLVGAREGIRRHEPVNGAVTKFYSSRLGLQQAIGRVFPSLKSRF